MSVLIHVWTFVFIVVCSVLQSAEVAIVVSDGYTSKLIPGSEVSLWQGDAVLEGGSTDQKGRHVFNNLQVGSYIVQVRNIGYCTRRKEVRIIDHHDSLVLNISLDYGSRVDCGSGSVQKAAGADHVVLTIEKYKLIDGEMRVQIKVRNTLSEPIYVPQQVECHDVYRPVVKDQQNRDVKPDFVDMACDVISYGHWRYYFHDSDLVEIRPGSSKKLDWISVKLYSPESLKGKWVKVIYEFDRLKPLDNCLSSVVDIPDDEMLKIRDIHCKLLDGTFETNYVFVN